MLRPKGPMRISIQFVHNPDDPNDRPEDCGYGEIELDPGIDLPAVGDMIDRTTTSAAPRSRAGQSPCSRATSSI